MARKLIVFKDLYLTIIINTNSNKYLPVSVYKKNKNF